MLTITETPAVAESLIPYLAAMSKQPDKKKRRRSLTASRSMPYIASKDIQNCSSMDLLRIAERY